MTTRDRLAPWALLALILVVTILGPAEKTLGSTARIIYLHGALVWVAMMAFVVAALIGAAALLARRDWLHSWSCAAGRVALLFWIGYLPLSMWAAQAAWGRVFFEDPSFQRAFRILAVALIVQAIIWLLPRPIWAASLLNQIPLATMLLLFAGAEQFMHPASPIRNAESSLIQIYFYFLAALCASQAVLVGRWLLRQGCKQVS